MHLPLLVKYIIKFCFVSDSINGEEMNAKTIAEIEQAVASAKSNLPEPVVIAFKPPVTQLPE